MLIEVGGANTLAAFNGGAARQEAGAGDGRSRSRIRRTFGEPRLAGQTVKYDVTVKALKKKTYPEKDEEFAKQLGDYESWDDFETKLREMAATGRKKDALESQAKDSHAGGDDCQVPVPCSGDVCAAAD